MDKSVEREINKLSGEIKSTNNHLNKVKRGLIGDLRVSKPKINNNSFADGVNIESLSRNKHNLSHYSEYDWGKRREKIAKEASGYLGKKEMREYEPPSIKSEDSFAQKIYKKFKFILWNSMK